MTRQRVLDIALGVLVALFLAGLAMVWADHVLVVRICERAPQVCAPTAAPVPAQASQPAPTPQPAAPAKSP